MATLELVILEGPQQGKVLQTEESGVRIGRTKASKLQVKDPSVSERHAEVIYKEDKWYIKELGSSNGTCVNGKAIDTKDGLVVLKTGDLIKLGTDSVAQVKIITTQATSSVTVQQFLESEYLQLEETLRAHAEQLGQQMRKVLTSEKQQLIGESSTLLC